MVQETYFFIYYLFLRGNTYKEHLLESIFSEQLEQEFYYSGKYISQQFREHTGLTIRSYIVDKRISLTKSHLSAGKPSPS